MREDMHIHLERGAYTLEWVRAIAKQAHARGIARIGLLEHAYLFREFLPVYTRYSDNADAGIRDWFWRKAAAKDLSAFLALQETVGSAEFPVEICFGLEMDFAPEHAEAIYRLTKDLPLDFLTGSVHDANGFAFDHAAAHWQGRDVERVYRDYFATEMQLAESGLFTIAAHPDCIRLFGHRPSFDLRPTFEALAAALQKSGTAAELNSGVHRRTGAPLGLDPALLAAFVRQGVRLVTVSDAHTLADVGDGIAALEQLAGRACKSAKQEAAQNHIGFDSRQLKKG